MTVHVRAAPLPAFRLIPSRFPPIGLFDTVTTSDDLGAVMELAGWTNDRLVAARVRRLPRHEWVFGRPNASIVMAAFLHAAPTGSRFNGPDLGAWYAAGSLTTGLIEVAHHLRREAVATGVASHRRTYRCYTARMTGDHRAVEGDPDAAGVLAPDDYTASQAFGEAVRKSAFAGIVYPSVRHAGGGNVVGYRPSQVLDVTQGEHVAVTVTAAERTIRAELLTAR